MSTRARNAVLESSSREDCSMHLQLWLRTLLTPSMPQNISQDLTGSHGISQATRATRATSMANLCPTEFSTLPEICQDLPRSAKLPMSPQIPPGPTSPWMTLGVFEVVQRAAHINMFALICIERLIHFDPKIQWKFLAKMDVEGSTSPVFQTAR